jgi:hypothetical protein
MMKKIQRILPVISVLFLLSGCLSSGVEITVNKDGSGEIIQTFQVQKEYLGFMNLGDAATDPNMIDKAELANRAKTMGEGVTFRKVEPVSPNSSYAGYKAYFAFTDIRNVRTSATPMTSPGENVVESELIRFDFKKGGTSTLTMITQSVDDQYDEDDDYDSDDEDLEAEQVDDGMKEQMKQIYKTMHFWFKVKVNGNITDTNALYADQSEITIMDMKFEKIIENDALFTEMTSQKNSSLEEVRDQLEALGVKIDDQEKIEISFR